MFLGKSHSACCPVSSYSWHRPGDGARENGIQRADQTKRVGRMWVKVWIKLSLQVSLRVEIILIHLWIFLMFSNCFPPQQHRHSMLRHFPGTQQPLDVNLFQQHLNHHKSQYPRI